MNKAMLFIPRKLTLPSSWYGHIPFVGWLINQHRQKTIVELGTHYGDSYFAICQSVLENDTGSKCYSIDTWQGDEQSGYYGEEVYTEFFAYHQQVYSGFSSIMRMTFDEANKYFNEDEIDLLHIDGLHTYEAVKHDFETWLPKMSNCGIILFHDINVHERNFGVWRLWEELKKKYTHFHFNHSHGLGILFVGSESHPVLVKLRTMANDDIIRDLFSRLGELVVLRCPTQNAHKTQLEQDAQITNLNQTLAERDRQIANLKQVVSSKENIENKLTAIYSSKTWKLINFIQKAFRYKINE